jgi:thiol-disulfide isomerase/thioredoxin
MKKVFTVSLSFLIALTVSSQNTFKVSTDPKNSQVLIFQGIVEKSELQKEKSFDWFAENQKGFTPDSNLVNGLRVNKCKISFLIFGGTWCDDTQFILPKFYKAQELAGLSDTSIVFFGVDRDKKSIGNLSQLFNIKNVPTIIVMKEGKEFGRLVEYGKTGKWDAELAEMIK